MVAHYPFNNNANDASDSGNDGTVYGPILTDDRFGYPTSAYQFDGIDDFIDLSQSLPIGSTDNTISMWVKIPEVGQGLDSGERVGILIGNFPNSPNSNWEINQGEVRIWWNNGHFQANGTSDLKDNKWHHLAFVRDTSK